MKNVYALKNILAHFNIGACTFLGLSFFLAPGCTSCRSNLADSNSDNLDAKESLQSDKNIPAAELGRFIKKHCRAQASHENLDTPVIQAFYAAESSPRELFLTEIFASDPSHSECAPGPFLFQNDNEADDISQRWQLKQTPTYFVLQLTNASTNEENFYIANQNGFPINSQSFRLKQEDSTTLVLLPKSSLEHNKTYYLYLIQTQGESRRVWIQPLSLLAQKND
jgi:hypothetical protein